MSDRRLRSSKARSTISPPPAISTITRASRKDSQRERVVVDLTQDDDDAEPKAKRTKQTHCKGKKLAPPSQKAARLGFFDLPRELRDMVYQNLNDDDDNDDDDRDQLSLDPYVINKQFGEEAIRYLKGDSLEMSVMFPVTVSKSKTLSICKQPCDPRAESEYDPIVRNYSQWSKTPWLKDHEWDWVSVTCGCELPDGTLDATYHFWTIWDTMRDCRTLTSFAENEEGHSHALHTMFDLLRAKVAESFEERSGTGVSLKEVNLILQAFHRYAAREKFKYKKGCHYCGTKKSNTKQELEAELADLQ